MKNSFILSSFIIFISLSQASIAFAQQLSELKTQTIDAVDLSQLATTNLESISSGQSSKITRSLYNEQDTLLNELLEATSSYKLSYSFEKILNAQENFKPQIRLRPKVSPRRMVFNFNQGQTGNYNTPYFDYNSTYLVLDTVTASIDTGLELKEMFKKKWSSINIGDVSIGYQIRRLKFVDEFKLSKQQANELKDLVYLQNKLQQDEMSLNADELKRYFTYQKYASSSISQLTKSNLSASEIEKLEKELDVKWSEDKSKIVKSLDSFLTKMESGLEKKADYFFDQDEALLYFQNFFDPIRMAYKYIDLDSNKLVTYMGKDEIVVISYFVKVSPVVFSIADGLFDINLYPKIYINEFRNAYKRQNKTSDQDQVDNLRILVKSEKFKAIEHEINSSLGSGLLNFNLLRATSNESDYRSKAKLYSFDFGQQEAKDMFDKIHKQTVPHLLQANSVITNGVDYLADISKNSLEDKIETKTRFEVLVLRAKYSKVFDLFRQHTIDKNMDQEHLEYIGNYVSADSFVSRLIYKQKEYQLRKANAFVKLNANNEDIEALNIKFHLQIEDSRTYKEHELKNYIASLKAMLNLDILLQSGSNAAKKVQQLLENNWNNSSKSDSSQFISAELSMSPSFTEMILINLNHLNVQQIRQLVFDYFIKDKKHYSAILFGERHSSSNESKNSFISNDCTDLLKNPEQLFDQNISLKCSRVSAKLRSIIKSLVDVKNARGKDSFVQLMKEINQSEGRSFVSGILVQLALIKTESIKSEQTKYQYENIDNFFDNNLLKLKISMLSKNKKSSDSSTNNIVATTDNTDAPLVFGDLSELRPYQVQNDIIMLQPNLGERRILSLKMWLQKTTDKVFVEFSSPTRFDSMHDNYVIRAQINKFKMLRSDDPIYKIENFLLNPVELKNREGNTYYKYVFSFDLKNANRLELDQDYIMKLSVHRQNSNRMTEHAETMFQLPLKAE